METREPVDLLVRATGLSRRAFAREYGVGEQVLLRVSQGRFTKLPPSVERAIEDAYEPDQLAIMLREGYGVQDLGMAYGIWREEQPVGKLPTEGELRKAKGDSPAQKLANAVGSMSKLAKLLHVHDYVVRRYVSGLTRELPHSMRDSMEKLGWPHVDHLDYAQQAWLDGEGR